jgi:hypothetical protein
MKHADYLNTTNTTTIAGVLKNYPITSDDIEKALQKYLKKQEKHLKKDCPWTSFKMFELFTEALGLGGTLWYSEKFLNSSSKHSPLTYITVETAALFSGFVLGKLPSFVLYAWKKSRLPHKQEGIEALLQELGTLETSNTI